MPGYLRYVTSTVIQNALPGTAAETIVGQVQVTSIAPDSLVSIDAWAKITTGTSTTSIVPRIRRATVAGTLVGEANPLTIIGAVGSTNLYDDHVVDQPGDVAGLLYVFTIVQTAVTVAGTVLAVTIRALVE